MVNVRLDCRGMEIHEVCEAIFQDRGIEDSYHFMNPNENDLIALDSMRNIDMAERIINKAIRNGWSIGILFDCDLDGVTSGTIMYRYLKKCGVEAKTFINKGKMHGVIPIDIDAYKKFDLFIIVDSLNSTINEYKEMTVNSNIKHIVVLDHHDINPEIPYDDYICLVSSQRNYANPALSGSGVTWKTCKYLDMVNHTDYADDLVDLAGAGICSDVMDMTVMENRYIVSKSLENLTNPAMKKIVGGFDWNCKAILFSVAPLINASMRVGDNKAAMEAFKNDVDVTDYVKTLKKDKEIQNNEVARLMTQVAAQCESQKNKNVIIVIIKSDYGVSGLLGNRLLEIYKRPIIVFNDRDGSDRLCGSMRAVGVDDFKQMINDSGIGVSIGHENAAGVEVDRKDLDRFIEYLNDHLPTFGTYKEDIDADIWIDMPDITRDFIGGIQEINKISGNGFQPIKVYISGITNFEYTSMSNGKHLVIVIPDTQIRLIQWNFNGNWEMINDAWIMGEELECVVELQKGFIGRTFMLQGIIQWFGIKEEKL